MNDKIDIVVTWVDGSDEEWIKEKEKYSPNNNDNSASKNRYRDWGLLPYWFRGIEQNASWVNHIYFVTCGHCPEWLNLGNPKLTLVKHSDYIPKEYLPTFNSNTIEMFVHRIPNLSEKFILFNDDMYIISKTRPEDFFKNGLPCESALLGILTCNQIEDVFTHTILNNFCIINKYFNKSKVLRDNYKKFFSLKYGKDIIGNIALIPFKFFSDFRDLHLPTSHEKKYFEKIWELEYDRLSQGVASKFRSTNDIMHWLVKVWYMCEGCFEPRSPKWGKRFELGENEDVYTCIKEKKYKAICINDSNPKLDFEETQKRLLECFESILPNKSSFER